MCIPSWSPSAKEILEDLRSIPLRRLAVSSERAALGMRVMAHGKDYFTNKTPFTTVDQLEATRLQVGRTGQL